jgi:intracellular sulfur oxidation DsrE/DsrF family protein
MLDLTRSTRRRGFLGTLAAGAAAIGITSLATPFSLNSEPKVLHQGADNSEFEMWLGKIKGKHRQVFDAAGANDKNEAMVPFAWSRVFLMTNKSLGVAEDDLTAVVILRHAAIPLGMGHDLWAKYNFGEVFKIEDKATKAPAVRNPFYQPKEGELPLPGMDIESLQKSGVLIGLCDMAMTFFSKHVFAAKMNMDADAIKKEWVAGILPGIQIVPSGVLAVNRAQEHGCTYCIAR